MAILRKVADALSKVVRVLMSLLLVLMVVSMAAQVFSRWLGISLSWTEELTRFACVWLIFLGSAKLAEESEHISVTILDGLLKGKALLYLNVFRRALFAIFSLILVWVGFQAAGMVARQISPNMGVSMNWMYISIPLGSLFTAFYLLINLFAPPKEEIVEGGERT